MKIICRFCHELHTRTMLCSKKYCYEYIFIQFFINILIDFKPRTFLEFDNFATKKIKDNNLFIESPDPFVIMRENLVIFTKDYDWL